MTEVLHSLAYWFATSFTKVILYQGTHNVVTSKGEQRNKDECCCYNSNGRVWKKGAEGTVLVREGQGYYPNKAVQGSKCGQVKHNSSNGMIKPKHFLIFFALEKLACFTEDFFIADLIISQISLYCFPL